MKKNKAFSLAEVLITLGIIGVITSITIPNFISKYNKMVTENRLKTAYSQLSKVLQTVYNNNDLRFAPEELYSNKYNNGFSYELSRDIFQKYFEPCFKEVIPLNKGERKVCNYKGENSTGICMAIDKNTGSMPFQIITDTSKFKKLIAGKNVFGFRVSRNIFESNYNINLTYSANADNANTEQAKNACISKNVFTNGTDREFYCSVLIIKNNWIIPEDYPIKF